MNNAYKIGLALNLQNELMQKKANEDPSLDLLNNIGGPGANEGTGGLAGGLAGGLTGGLAGTLIPLLIAKLLRKRLPQAGLGGASRLGATGKLGYNPLRIGHTPPKIGYNPPQLG